MEDLMPQPVPLLAGQAVAIIDNGEAIINKPKKLQYLPYYITLPVEMPASITNCRCKYVPPRHFDYDRKHIGVDETNGRFAEVSIDTCKYCGTQWINYFYEVEGFSSSGRWYRGIIGEEAAATINASTAAAWLEQLDQYMYGGSYFGTEGAYGRGKIS